MTDFVKRNSGAPASYFGWEAAGLRWLSDVDEGVPQGQLENALGIIDALIGHLERETTGAA